MFSRHLVEPKHECDEWSGVLFQGDKLREDSTDTVPLDQASGEPRDEDVGKVRAYLCSEA